MYARLAAALASGLLTVSAAEAAITVNFMVGSQQPLVCAAAENVRLLPAATVSATRFSFDCAADGVRRTCQPAVATNDPDILPNGPNVKYTPTGGGATISVVCDDGPAAAPISIKGTHVRGIAGAAAVDCHPVQAVAPLQTISFEPNASFESCIAGSGPGTGPCLRYQCPGDQAPRACFPVAETVYSPRLADTEPALRRVDILCELRPPMLSNHFDG